MNFTREVMRLEKRLIVDAIDIMEGNIASAARYLKLQRTTLFMKIKKLELCGYVDKIRKYSKQKEKVS
jgi:DNA-binding NtrC family response regulator